jgi:hypothetical protein
MQFSPQFAFKKINYNHIYLNYIWLNKGCVFCLVSNSQYVGFCKDKIFLHFGVFSF